MSVDTATAARFLAALTGDRTHTFQTFAEADKLKRGQGRVLHGSLESRCRLLSSLNEQGAGVFVMVNRGDGNGRKSANVTAARALFVDLDGAPVEPVLDCQLPPRIVVESSPGKWHCYWPIVDLPLERFTDAQKALAHLFAGDPKVCDRARVMRLPGFLHRKDGAYQTRLVRADRAPLTWHEMVQAFDLRDRFILPDVIPEGERNSKLFKLATSAAQKGVPEAKQLEKAQTVNAQRCHPPLNPAEVAQIVASAYRMPAQGVAAIPLTVLDGEAYRLLDDACRTLLMLAYRRADGFNGGLVTLPFSELGRWFPRKDTFHAVRRRLVASGLVSVERTATVAMPRHGKGPRAGFYRLAIGPFGVAYNQAKIGPFGVAPEALQAVGSEALEASDFENGQPESGMRAA